MKRKILLILLLCIFSTLLTGCITTGNYKPVGEVYVKTGPSHGDAGATDVIDIEIEKEKYDLNINNKIQVQIGYGHLEKQSSYENEIYGKITIYVSKYRSISEEPYNKQEYIYNDYYSEKYNTYQEERVFDFLPTFYYYPHFYPIYKEERTVEIPLDITGGYIIITNKLYNDQSQIETNEFSRIVQIELKFETENNILTFIND